MSIPVQQARGIFTQTAIEKYREMVSVPSFLRSFFAVKTTPAKYVSIEVQRGTEKVAVDVLRGTDGNRNTFDKSTEKIFEPPFYNETFNATSLDRYDLAFGADPMFTPATIGYMASDVAEKLAMLKAKIDRAKELQCAQVLLSGTVTVKNGDSVDYKRKADSIKDNSGSPWATVATDIEAQCITGAEFIRTKGKNNTGVFDMIMSGKVFVAFKKSDFFKNNANFNQVKLIDITSPAKNSTGAAYHGQFSFGAYIANVWTYDEVYDNESGVSTRYLDDKYVVMLPTTGAKLTMAHAGIPAILRDVQNAEFPAYITQMEAEEYVNNYIDEKAKAHWFEIYSAPLAVPVTVDMIYTMKVLSA